MASNSSPASPSAPARRKKSKSSAKWWIIGGLVVIVLLGVAGVAKSRKQGHGTKVFVATVERRDITQFVTATGKIEPEVEVKIAPEVSGEIVELPLQEGARVTRGQLLMRIKDDNYRYQVDQREADLAAARASAVQNNAQLIKAREDFTRSEDLFGKKLISPSDYTAARTTLEVAQANHESALAQVRRAEGLLKQAQDQLEKTVIYAPMDGTISLLAVEVGERVAGTGQFNSAEVMRVADLSNMEVVVRVNENDVVNVKVGDVARIDIDAFPNRDFRGEVTEIASTAITSGQNTQAEVTNFEVRIRVDTAGQNVRPGMSALADIETSTVRGVVTVPIQSVTVRSREENKTVEQIAADREREQRENKGEGAATAENVEERRRTEREDRDSLRRVVFVIEAGKAKLVDVETGIADTTHMQITSGLEVGQQVVSGSYATITRTLKDDMAVQIEERGSAAKSNED